MATYDGPLTNAPIREALIDFQYSSPVSIDMINGFASIAQTRFGQPRSSPIWKAPFGFVSNPESATGLPPDSQTPNLAQSRREAVGFRLTSAEFPHVLLCRTTGFTFSRLTPYECWENLRLAAKAEWDSFIKTSSERSELSELSVNKVAVRYINELKIPLPLKDFAQYLACPPEVPSNLPQGVSSFLQQVVIPDSTNDCVSVITQALEPASEPSEHYVSVLLDITVSSTVHVKSMDSDKIWQVLDKLRIQKNKMFFNHITDEMVDILK